MWTIEWITLIWLWTLLALVLHSVMLCQLTVKWQLRYMRHAVIKSFLNHQIRDVMSSYGQMASPYTQHVVRTSLLNYLLKFNENNLWMIKWITPSWLCMLLALVLHSVMLCLPTVRWPFHKRYTSLLGVSWITNSNFKIAVMVTIDWVTPSWLWRLFSLV